LGWGEEIACRKDRGRGVRGPGGGEGRRGEKEGLERGGGGDDAGLKGKEK